MKELLIYTDYVLVFLFICISLLLLLRIIPRTYRFYRRLKFQQDSEKVKSFGYFTDSSFWAWLLSKEGRVDIYKDVLQQKTVYYNNFKLFNILWKITLVVFTFRVLVMLFGPTST